MRVNRPSFLTSSIWLPQGELSAVQATLPDNKVFAVEPKISGIDPKSLYGRAGLTHLQNRAFPDGTEYQVVNRQRQYILPNADLPAGNTVADYQHLASSIIPPSGIDGDQFGEGQYNVSAISDQARAYYNARRTAATSFGITNVKFMGTYGSLDYYFPRGQFRTNPLTLRSYYASVAAARTSCSYFTTGTYNDVGANVSLYSDYYDYAQDYYRRKHGMEIMRLGQNRDGGPTDFCPLFFWGEIENGNEPSGSLHNLIRYRRRTTNPLGTVTCRPEHPQADFSFLEACAYVTGFVIGSGVIAWSPSAQFSTNVNSMSAIQTNGTVDSFSPDVPGGSIPVIDPAFPSHPHSFVEAAWSAAHLYCQTHRTSGTSWQYCRYRVKADGMMDYGPWIEPEADGSTILDHWADGQILASNGTVQTFGGRADIMGRVAGVYADYFIFHPMTGKHTAATYELQIGTNGPVFTQRAYGGILNPYSE